MNLNVVIGFILFCVVGFFQVQVLDVLPLSALVDSIEEIIGKAVDGSFEEKGAHTKGGKVTRRTLEENIVDLTSQSHFYLSTIYL